MSHSPRQIEIQLDMARKGPCTQCDMPMLCACPSCLLDESQIPDGFTFWVSVDEKATVDIDGEQIEIDLPFAKCNNCGYTWEMDGDDDPAIIALEEKNWPSVIL